MGRNRESRTGIAVLAFIVASAAAQFNSPADVRGDCTGKADGIYPTDHCSTYFLECSGGRTTKQNCSTGLWFNPQSSQCDYREKIVACQDPFSCEDREDGVYGEGCSSMFWYCSGGKLKHSSCPAGTFFNVDAQKCDFRSKIRACGGATKPRPSRLTTVAPTTLSPTTSSPTTSTTEQTTEIASDSTEVPYGKTYPTYAPRQRISGRVSKTPLSESSAGTACAGKEDGSHATKPCSGEYVLCWAGTGQVMHCQQGLMFNEASGNCDYPMNVTGCSETASASSIPSAPSAYGGAAPLASAAPSTASLPIPRQPVDIDCSTLSDGVYGSSCTRDFFQCVAGMAYAKSCTEGLVYNPDKKQCDYKENCGSSSSSVVSSDAPSTTIPVVTTVQTTINFDCSSRPDGAYSRGCEAEFYQCVAGMVNIQKCPEGLVFDDLTKGCDYPSICSAPHTTAAQDSSDSVYSRAPTTAIPTAATPVSFDCSSREDGLYSEGCVSDFVKCSSGVANSFRCPDGLVIDVVSKQCEYPDKCGQSGPLEQDTTVYQQSQPVPSYDHTEKKLSQTTLLAFDCSSHSDGMYGEGCSPHFFQCVAGMVYSQTCPTGLVFDQRTGNCDYPERCGQQQDAVVEMPVVETATELPVQPPKPTLTPSDIDCFGRADGMYSSGCTRTFVQCANGMAFNSLCPEGLVFVQEIALCDYPAKCGSPSETTPAASVPATSAPYKPLVKKTPSTPVSPKRDEPSGVLIDCTSLADGTYTSGCTHAFVQCSSGNAYPLECQAGLVFDKRVEQCVWPENCSSELAPSLPTVTMPSRPSDAPSTVYDMKEEKEQMVTDARLPQVSNDGSVCTGTGRRAMGKCSSGFVQCIGGKMVARRCPGQSLFDEKIGLCVYDLDGCEMDVEEVEVSDQETTVAATVAPHQDTPAGYGTQPVQTAPSYPQQTAYQQYSQSNPQDQYYQNGYQTQATSQYQSGYPTGYQATPPQDYPTGYQPATQDAQYQNGYGYQSAEYSSVPVYSSFGDSSLPPQSLSPPECEIGSFRRVSACSSSFDSCSPTARQWVRRICGKSHRFDSTVNRCRPIFEVRECDEPMSSYVPPPVQSDAPAIYPNPASSFEYGVPLSGREYEEKHVVDPFKGGYQSGMMGSNPFIAVGNTGSFYTEDGLRWVGSAWSEGGEKRRGGKRHHKQRKHHHHSGDYVVVSGNPFGAGRDRVLKDEWKGRKEVDGPLRSNLIAARGHRVRNVVDQFKGRVSHFDAPLGAVNPFAVKRADGHRRRGRKSCRRDKHRRREDWDDEECEEKREKERPTERPMDEMEDEDEDERPAEIERESSMEENENTESINESADENETPVESESEANELESEKNEETESKADPELMPESIESEEKEETEEGVNEVEKEEPEETTTTKGPFEEVDEKIEEREEEEEENDDEEVESEDSEDGSTEGEETTDGEKMEERAESETGETENAMEDLNEDDADQEFEEDGESEKAVEEKNEDVESPESVESEEKGEVTEEKEDEGETDEGKESIRETEEIEKEEGMEDGEKVEESEEMAENGEKEETPINEEGTEENEEEVEEEKEEVKDEEIPQSEEAVEGEDNEEEKETSETVDQSEETMEDKNEEESEVGEAEETKEEVIDGEETAIEEDVKEDAEETEEIVENGEEKKSDEKDVERSESIEEAEETEENEEDGVKDETEETASKGPFEEVDEKIEERERENEEPEEEIEDNEEMEDPEETETEQNEEGETGVDEGEVKKSKETIPETEEKQEEGTEIELRFNPEEKTEVTETEKEEAPEEKAEDEAEISPSSEDGEEEEEESGTDDSENAAEELNEDDVDKEMGEDGESEQEVETTTEDVESPESMERENGKNPEEPEDIGNNEEEVEDEDGMNEEKENEDVDDGEIPQSEEAVEGDETEKEEGIEDGEKVEESEEKDETPVNEEGIEEDGEEVEEVVGNEEENNESKRRRRSIVYDVSAPTQSMANRRLSLPRSSRLHRSRFSRLCASSTGGQAISIGQCRQDFVYCKSARRPVVAACPVGDLFDAVMATCVPTEICGAERTKQDAPSTDSSYVREGERPTMPSPTTTTSLHYTQKTVVVTEDDCSSLSDGAYPLSDCSANYFVCAASVKHVYRCPEETVYHKASDSCEWPARVAGCAAGTAATDATPSPVTEATEGYSRQSVVREGMATTEPTTVSPMHVHFDCKNNGGFALDCKGGFVMCSNGQASFMKCPHGLVFEESTQSCQYPAHVGSCGLMPVPSLDAPSTVSTVYTPPTTAVPARAVEVLVKTPVDRDACSGISSGLHGASGVCPSSFVICTEGVVTAVMNCPEGTFFDEKTKKCNYREIACAGGWSGEAHGVESPVQQDVPTVSPVTEDSEEYGRRSSRPYRPSMPVAVEKMEKEEEVKRDELVVVEEKPVVVPSIVEPVKGASCDWKGAASSGVCSSQFITCSNGRPEVFDCAAGLVFAPSTSACEYPEFVSGCPQFKDTSSPYRPSLTPSTISPYRPSPASPPSTASSVSDAVVVEEAISEYSRDETPSTTTENPLFPSLKTGDHTTAKFEATGDHCTFTADRPSFPLNYCSMTYAVCTSEGLAYRTNCTFGYLFDSVIRRCVPSEHCGQPYLKEISGASSPSSPLHSPTAWAGDSRCVGVKDGSLKASALCSGHYIRCLKEGVVMETCSGAAEVFSPLTGRCVLRVQMAECSSSPRGSTPAITRPKTVTPVVPSADGVSSDSYPTALPPPSHRGARIRGLPVSSSPSQFDARSFCTTKHTDGLYRNPENCAGIVQCFGGEAFSYPSCAPGLFFNEVDGQCDYASNVPECASQADPVALDDTSASCKGQPHGAHLADDSNCSIYYRCVWGSLERLKCPDGTVFNPRLSVCDYPSEVPHCQKQ